MMITMTMTVSESAAPTLLFVDDISALCRCCQLPQTHNSFRSHRQHAAYRTRIPATTTSASGSARREPVMDRTTTMWVSPCHPFSFLSIPPSLLPLPCMVLCCESVYAQRALANTSSFQTPDYPLVCCHHGRAQVPISRLAPRTPARHVLEDALSLLPNSLLILAPECLFRRISTSILYMLFVRRVGVFESCVTRSSRFWLSLVGFGADARIACWVLSIFSKVAQLA